MKTRVIFLMMAGAMLMCVISKPAKAQFDQMFTQYMHNEMFINPAYAGAKGVMAFTLLHRQQWTGFPGRPITTTFSMNVPLLQAKMGVGLSYLNERIGALNRNLVYASYAYRVRTGSSSYLSFGLMGGAHLQVENLTDLYAPNSGDPLFSTNLGTVATPNFGFGVYFNDEKFYASLSIPRLLDDHIRFTPEGVYQKGVKFNLRSFHYYFAMGRMFNISDFFKMKPHLLTKVALNTPVEFDFNLDALIKEKLWLGVGYRTNADISAKAGLQIFPNVLLSYSYDYQLTKISKYSGGSHEIVLSYLFDYTGKKIVSPRYF